MDLKYFFNDAKKKNGLMLKMKISIKIYKKILYDENKKTNPKIAIKIKGF